MIHYHGGPITPASAAIKVWRGRHAMVSFAHPSQVGLAADICQSFVIDNGAFSAWRKGKPIANWEPYYQWCEKWLFHPGCDFAVIPDVIDGTEKENDALLAEWPFVDRGVPVWHMHESMERLDRLANSYLRVAVGSSGPYATVGTLMWWARIGEALDGLRMSAGFLECKLHGLRMLNPAIVRRLPLSSADSTVVARNIGLDKKWRGPYLPRSKETRGVVLAERIEAANSIGRWRELTRGTTDWVGA